MSHPRQHVHSRKPKYVNICPGRVNCWICYHTQKLPSLVLPAGSFYTVNIYEAGHASLACLYVYSISPKGSKLHDVLGW